MIPQKNDPSYLSINIRWIENISLKVKRTESIGHIRRSFCQKLKRKYSTIRFLLDGQRIDDTETVNSLNLKNEDVIDAFMEMDGGGLPGKDNISSEEVNKILDSDLVNEKTFHYDSSSSSGGEDLYRKFQGNESQSVRKRIKINIPVNIEEIQDLMKESSEKKSSAFNDNDVIPKINKEKVFENQSVGVESNTGNNDENDCLLIDDLRNQYNDGKLKKGNPLHQKIIYYIQLPSIAPIELKILHNLVEMKDKHNEWEKETNKVNQTFSKNLTKRKRKDIGTKINRKLRSKSNNMEIEESITFVDAITKIQNPSEIIQPDQKDIVDISTLYTRLPQTPTQRGNLFKKFGLSTPSPIIKQASITKEEMRRFSVAVHLWADRKCGGIQMLQTVRLTYKHLKEILVYTGPGSNWNLLKNRSIMQYKSMWQNLHNKSQYYRGHHQTGFETDLKVHSPISPFCPFEHCQSGIMSTFDLDLMSMTPNKISTTDAVDTLDTTDTTVKVNINRKLFSVEEEDSDKDIGTGRTKKTSLRGAQFRYQCIEKPSPTKQELKNQNVYLKQQIQMMKNKLKTNDTNQKEKQIFIAPTLIKCDIDSCSKEFGSVFGLEKHQKLIHGREKIEQKNLQLCTLCGKNVIYIDQHIARIHKNALADAVCDICQKVVKVDMKKHRGTCISCPFCEYENRKKTRLLKHIENCIKRQEIKTIQQEPLDLTSPRKEILERNDQFIDESHDVNHIQKKATTSSLNSIREQSDRTNMLMLDDVDPVHQIGSNKQELEDNEASIDLSSDFNRSESFPNKKRIKYPFDYKNEEESYLSELEEFDSEEYTLERRYIKDNLELELREIDSLTNPNHEGDDLIVEKFRIYMERKTRRAKKTGGYSQMNEVTTVGMYSQAVKKDILVAFHQLFSPFDSRWILDCITPKTCTFEGEERCFVSPEEPIYMTSRILDEALKKYDSNTGETGGQRSTVLKAAVQFMDFIELEFNKRLNIHGTGPSEKVLTYHKLVRTYIRGTAAWKTCNEGKEQAMQNKKTIEEYENPNKELIILEKYQEYISSSERLSNLTKVLNYSSNESPKPSNGQMSELGRIIMGEIVATCGCRPIVVCHLTNGGYADKTPGFNPHKIKPGDSVVDEEQGNQKIYRRVNPNLPPKDKACKHQLENKTAECPVLCEERCQPEGYNIRVTWDKTQSSHGASYLHITYPLKVVMDSYYTVRSRFFEGRKSPVTSIDDWLHDDDTPFFLNSAGSGLKFLDLKHISEAMGTDVTAYSFRKIVSTWAQSHESEEIRNAEEEALQHKSQKIKDVYLQNKKIKPQILTSTYIEEDNLFPKEIRDEIEKTEIKNRDVDKQTEDGRIKKRYETLLKNKEAYKKSQLENKPLGPKHRILRSNIEMFKEIIEEITDEDIQKLLKQMKPLEWRNYLVRLLCRDEGLGVEELRKLWVKIYKGDLRWGVRDARFKAKEKKWPIMDSNSFTRNKDRNSWICGSIRKSLLTQMKVNEKKNYIKNLKT